MAVTNPLSGLLDGILQGHQIAMQLHRQAQEDQAFKTNQALHEQQMSMQDIMNHEHMMSIGRPVVNGTVQDQMNGLATPTSSGSPGAAEGETPDISNLPVKPGPTLPAAPINFVRKADRSRVVASTDRFGNKTETELYTPEEQNQRAITRETGNMSALEKAKLQAQTDAQQSVLEGQRKLRGVPVPEEFAAGYPAGQKLLQEEIFAKRQQALQLQKEQEDATKAGERDVAPGHTIINPSKLGPDGKPRVVATGGTEPATGEFGAYLRASLMKKGYTEQNAPPDLVMQATTDYATKAKNPADLEAARQMRALTMQLTQAHIDDLKSKQSTTSTPIEAGTREFRVAQDLAYGKLTMQQFRSLTAYSRDTNKKMDIYDKASELNPNFNPAQFEMGFKFASNPKSQQQLASMDNVTKGAADLLKFSDAASRTGVTAVNKIVMPGGVALGGKKYSDFHTAQVAFADELSGALGFGNATDMSKQMGIDMTNPNLSPENFRSAVQNVVLPFVERKRKSMLDQMGVYGQQGMNPGAPGGAAPAPAAATAPAPAAAAAAPGGASPYVRTAAGQQGHQIGQKADGLWYDVQTGAKVQ